MSSSTTYQKRWRYERAQGRARTVAIARTKTYLGELIAVGWSPAAIAEAAEMTTPGVHWILEHAERIRVTTARRLLAITPGLLIARANDQALVPAIGARRRLQALQALGWSHSELTRRAGTNTRHLAEDRPWITRANHDRVTAIYRELAMTPGPSAKARGWAAKLGYAPPLAWDEESIDDPGASACMTEESSAKLDLDEFLHLTRGGESPERAAARLGQSLAQVRKEAAHHGRDDVLARATRSAA